MGSLLRLSSVVGAVLLVAAPFAATAQTYIPATSTNGYGEPVQSNTGNGYANYGYGATGYAQPKPQQQQPAQQQRNTNDAAQTEDPIRRENNGIEIHAGANRNRYGESGRGIALDTEDGWIPSFGAEIGYQTGERSNPWLSDLYLHLDAEANLGNTDYDGHLQDGSGNIVGPYKTTTHNEIYELSAQFGRGFPFLGRHLMLTPYIDGGYRLWVRSLDGPSAGDEHYQNGEVMGGLMVQYAPIDQLVLSLSGEGGTTFGANMSINNSNFPLGESGIYKFKAKAGYMLSRHFEATTSLVYSGFGYGTSQPGTFQSGNFLYSAIEPHSYTHQTQALVGLAYHLY